jgi:hypothetical protein
MALAGPPRSHENELLPSLFSPDWGFCANFAMTAFSEVRKSGLDARCDTPREGIYWHA